jgi:hypothetical protein
MEEQTAFHKEELISLLKKLDKREKQLVMGKM